jgi:hypothetical protein
LKNVLDIWNGKIKGSSTSETVENFSILIILIGAVVLSFGIGLSVFSAPMSMIFSVFGAWVTFIFTAVLIFTWLVKEFKSD